MSRLLTRRKAQHLIRLASRRGVITAANLEVRRDIVGDVFVELRSVVAYGRLLVNDRSQRPHS